MPLRYQAITDIGRRRKANEDSHLEMPELGLYVVADGMGGQAAGDVASRMAVDVIAQFIKLTDEQRDITWPTGYLADLTWGQNRLRGAVLLANNEIYHSAQEDAGLRGMGTTAVCALSDERHLDLANIGDSRIYLMRDGALRLMTQDHSWISEQVQKGIISEDQARNHPYRNVVTKALGAGPDVEPDLSVIEMVDGDIVLLCTDGLTSMLTDADIESMLQRYGSDLDAAARALVYEANQNGGEDNITLTLLGYAKD